MQGSTIDLTSQVATYRRKLGKLAEHLAGLDDTARENFRYKGVRIRVAAADRPLLSLAEEAESLEGWQGACLDSIAISVLWADLLETKKKKEAEGKATAMRTVVAGFLDLAQRLSETLEEHRKEGTPARQRAVEHSYARVASLIDDASMHLAFDGRPDTTDPLAVSFHPTAARAERPDLESYLADSTTDLDRLAGLPGLSISRFGVQAGETEWFLTLPEGNALAGSAAPGHPNSESITRLLAFTAAASFRIARSYGWLLTPAHLEVPAEPPPTDREKAFDRAMIRQLAQLSDEIASRAEAAHDRELYQLATPVAARLGALDACVASATGGIDEASQIGHLPCPLRADDFAPPIPAAKPAEPKIEPPPTMVLEQMDLDGPGHAQELIEQAVGTGTLGAAPTALKTKAQPRRTSDRKREASPLARTKSERSVHVGRLVAASLFCFTSILFFGHTASQALAITSLAPVTPLSSLAPDVPSIRMASGEDEREAVVMMDEQAWRVFSPTEQYRRFGAACELLASNGYSSAVFRDRRDRELAIWRAGSIQLIDPEKDPQGQS